MAGYPGSDEITALLKTVLANQKALEAKVDTIEAKVDKMRIGQLHLLKDVHSKAPQELIDWGYEPCDLVEVGVELSELAKVDSRAATRKGGEEGCFLEPHEGPYSAGDAVVCEGPYRGKETKTSVIILDGPNDEGKYKGKRRYKPTPFWFPGEYIKGKQKAMPFKQLGFSLKELDKAQIDIAMSYQGGFTLGEIQDHLSNKKYPRKEKADIIIIEKLAARDTQMKELGFTAAECKAAGVSADDIYFLGYTPAELEDAGWPPKPSGEEEEVGWDRGRLLFD